MFFEDIDQWGRNWRDSGLERVRRTIESSQGPIIDVDGQSFLSFLSNDYLGLAADVRLVTALGAGAQRYGAGAGASPLISGHLACHHDAEEAVARFLGCSRALMFITGYMANIAALTTFAGEGDVIFSDALNHASIIDGCRLSKASVERFPHRNLEALATLLRETPARRKLIVTDAVFSMDGDTADLESLHELAERFDALLVVDDAHGFGVRGPQGRGSWALTGLTSSRVLQIITLGKAAGLSGAFVVGDERLINTLIQRARGYIYSTSPLPALASAVPVCLGILEEEEWRRTALVRLQAQMEAGLRALGYAISITTPIVPIILGKPALTMSTVERLRQRGLLVAGIRPPTVPDESSRLRVSISAAHSTADVERFLHIFREVRA
jgi:8-amino-7-oxononanoate synthase